MVRRIARPFGWRAVCVFAVAVAAARGRAEAHSAATGQAPGAQSPAKAPGASRQIVYPVRFSSAADLAKLLGEHFKSRSDGKAKSTRLIVIVGIKNTETEARK